MESKITPKVSTELKPLLFEYGLCGSFLLTVKNPKGAPTYATSNRSAFTLKSDITLPFESQFTSIGIVDGYYNTNNGWVSKDDISISDSPRFENTLIALKNLAMFENWDYSKNPSGRPLPILYNYLLHTFVRVKEENKIKEVDNYSCFNTGLVTENQEEIFMLFRKNKKTGEWNFKDFCKESSNELARFNPLPERALYFNKASDLIYDANIELRINIDHIVNDKDNFSRFPDEIKKLSKHQLINTFHGAVEHAKKRIKRNYLTAVPQYYRGYVANGQLQLLLPLCLIDPSKADLALAVFKNDGTYSGRTCLTLDMAINNARLITKPDDEWLKP